MDNTCYCLLLDNGSVYEHQTLHNFVPDYDSWNVVCELCLMLGGAKMWLIGFQILVLIMLYGLVTSTLWGFY